MHPIKRITINIHEDILSDLRWNAEQFTRELRMAAAVKWYELEKISQGAAAEIAGISRAEFIDALGRFGVTPFQVDAEELIREATDG